MQGLNRHSSSSFNTAGLNRNRPFTILRSTPVPIPGGKIDDKEVRRVLTCATTVFCSTPDTLVLLSQWVGQLFHCFASAVQTQSRTETCIERMSE